MFLHGSSSHKETVCMVLHKGQTSLGSRWTFFLIERVYDIWLFKKRKENMVPQWFSVIMVYIKPLSVPPEGQTPLDFKIFLRVYRMVYLLVE